MSNLDRKVLVLNKAYTPLRFISVRRALSLLIRDYAEAFEIEYGNYIGHDFGSWLELSVIRHEIEPEEHRWIKAVTAHIAVPEVVRLLYHGDAHKANMKFNRRNIYSRDKHKCQYCGRQFPTEELTLDHVVPRSQGGVLSWTNAVCCCVACNMYKANRTPKEADMELITKPVKPKNRFEIPRDPCEVWKHFIDEVYWETELDQT